MDEHIKVSQSDTDHPLGYGDIDFELYGLGLVSDTWCISFFHLGPYVPVDNIQGVPISFRPRSILHRHYGGGLSSQMNLEAWCYELSFENDSVLKSYLQRGICSGFSIVDSGSEIAPYICNNYKSIMMEPCYSFIDKLINAELAQGKYVLADDPPICVHALGAVRKANGSFRPITDCRRPEGRSINNFMYDTHQPFTYNTIDFVCSFLFHQCYKCTVDISSAYRSIHVAPFRLEVSLCSVENRRCEQILT